ncbi:MAG TPA: DoxX-like family protein [Gaiellaceae bacterium]|nr:DoxX-like family protein [Gaiellaceae bacterium]
MWLYHGVWCKLLGRCADQANIVASVPTVRKVAKQTLYAIGAVETAFAAWVISGRAPRLAAAAQTALLVGMNVGGLVWGRRHIPAPKGLVAENLVFLALVWWAAESDR